MNTIYDWVTIGIFAALIVLFLQRSSLPDPPDRLIHYLIAAVGCAAANYLGNEGLHLPAAALIVLTLGFVYISLRPFGRGGGE